MKSWINTNLDSKVDRGGAEEPTQAYFEYVEERDRRQQRYTNEGELV